MSFLNMKSKPWTGVDKVRVTPPNWTLAQAPTLKFVKVPANGSFVGNGLPAEMAYGPYLPKAFRLVLAGKQPFNWARPAGVGVRASVWKGLWVARIRSSNPLKKKALFLTSGPPKVMPPNSSLRRGF